MWPPHVRRVGVVLCGAALLALPACTSEAAVDVVTSSSTSTTSSTSSTSSTSTTSTTGAPSVAAGIEPVGFSAVRATSTAADGTVCELCLWLASTGEQRARGLMAVTDLGAGDGMAFVYESPHSGAFWMKDTVMPLSIAFYDESGAYLDAFDMAPCTADPCPTYPTPDGFVVAVEAAQGTVADLGLTPGSSLALTDLPCA